jgi:hypothetical protein
MGHDGQLYYMIARDPFGLGPTPGDLAAFDLNPPRYRYRRILYPLLAGGFGRFGGGATVLGMILCVAIGVGLATVATADLTYQLGLTGRTAFLAAANVGALVSAMILTADAFALGLALSGVALASRLRLGPAAAVFALACLTKEIYLLVPISISGWLWGKRFRREAIALATISSLPLALWSLWVWSNIPEAPPKISILELPMVGLFQGVARWMRLGDNSVQILLAIYTAISFITSVTMLLVGRNVMLRWLIAPWIVVAFCSASIAVWNVPSNVARGFAILWPLAMLLVSERFVGPSHLSERSGTSQVATK